METEERAAEMGWVPKEEWKGEPDKWRPAEEFVSRGENILPIVKDQLKKAKEEIAALVRLNTAEIEKVKKESYDRAKREHDAELDRLRREKFEAVQSGDVETYTKIEKKEQALKAPDEPKPAETVLESPVFVEWKGQNSWYGTDPDLTELAEFTAAKIHRETPGMEEKAFFEAVGGKVKAIRPDKFTNPNRDNPDLVEGGGTRQQKGKKSFADLPKEAQAAYHRLKPKLEKNGRKYEKDTYAMEYFAQG